MATALAPALYRRALPADARVSSWRAADGWALRRFDWPGGARGSMLFQVGRGDLFEKYLEVFAHWHALGWSITSLDWRGQGGSGRLGRDPHVGHCDDFSALVRDLERFFAEWSAEVASPRVLIGHSMGGHLVLQAMLDGRVRPDAAVLSAPMLGLKSPVGARAGERAARLMTRLGDPARAAWKGGEKPGRVNRQAMLTHDEARYADELWWHAAHTELRLGPPSWAWLHTAFVSTREQQADARLEALDVPTLLLVPLADALVDSRASLRVVSALPDVRVVTWGPESAHEVLREADPVRDAAIAAVDAFLDERAPAR